MANVKELRKVMEAIELLQTEKLISEKVASKYLTDYLIKQHEKEHPKEEVKSSAANVTALPNTTYKDVTRQMAEIPTTKYGLE